MTEVPKERAELRYSPSIQKVVPEEAENQNARANADLFIDRIYRLMDDSEHGARTLIPTSKDIIARYQEVQADDIWVHKPEGLFSLREAYGAAKRKLLFQKEQAAQWRNGTSSIAMKNIGDMYILMTAIELSLPIDQRSSI